MFRRIFLGIALTSISIQAPAAARSFDSHIPWTTQSYSYPKQVNVQFAGLKSEPTFIVHLPDGSSFLLKSQYRIPNLNFSDSEMESNANAARVIVQNFARLITSSQTYYLAYSEEKSQKSVALTLDEAKLRTAGYSQLDPLSGIFQLNANRTSGDVAAEPVVRVHFEIPESLIADGLKKPAPIDVKATTIRQRLASVLQFLLDGVVYSTGKAFKRNKSGRQEIHKTWDEVGFQFGLKLEALGGVGKVNLSASGALNFYFGFNKRTLRFVYRRGVRQDKLSDGVGASFGGKMEPKFYRMDSEYAYKADPREGYAVIRGETWYPTGIPAGSLAMDTGRGFQSDGIAVGPNFADFGGGFLMNTVTSFEEVQRISSFGLPDIADWINSIARQFELQKVYPGESRFFNQGRSAQIAKCEGVFRSTLEIGF